MIDEYLHWQKIQRGRPVSTLRVYEGVLRAYHRDVVGEREYDDISIEEIEAWVQRSRTGGQNGFESRPPAPATLARDVTILRTMYRWAHSRGLIERNPADLLHAPKPKNELPRPIPDDVWQEWWGAPLPVELRVGLALGFYGGLRRAEIASLQRGHVDVEGLRLLGFTRKGGGDGVLPLGTGLRVYAMKMSHLLGSVEEVTIPLRAVIGHGANDGLLVAWLEAYAPGVRRAEEFSRWIDRAGKRLRLPRFTCHQLRHSCATNLLRAGVPIAIVSRYLNHSDISTTMRYVRAGGDELGEWLSVHRPVG